MILKQKTIKGEVLLEGIGLHTGCKSRIVLKPAAENVGIVFVRVDLPGSPIIPANSESIQIATKIPRCTTIGKDDKAIHTVEHLMSVLAGLGITNLIIEIDAPELPGLDGSGIDYLNTIKKVGVLEQDATIKPFVVHEPIGVELNGSSIYVFPSSEFRISYSLNYNHPFLNSQFFNIVVNEESFTRDIAPCRTFCLEKEADELKANGLGKGANFQNTLVVGEHGVKENTLRFPDEFARHKTLDFIGDLYLLGVPIRGHVFAVKSGHTLNLLLLKKIDQLKKRYSEKTVVPCMDFKGLREIDINGIMNILPHRYPFLLVDRVIELEHGKKAIGIKNVTINDIFFQGHFPTRPVMPGVLMVEAMAQTAGVVVLTNEVHHGKVAFFMAVDKVKFRKVVVPGDQLLMEVEVIKDGSRIAQIHAQAKVGNDVVAEADMIFSFTDKSYLNS